MLLTLGAVAMTTNNGRAYDESLVRRFEPGSVEMLTRSTLAAHGFQLYYTRGLKSVRVRDRHDNYKKYTWTELEKFVDDLRVKSGREPIFRKRSGARATKRVLTQRAAETP